MIIAEIGINHNGDIEVAFALMDAAEEAGADAVKFQKRTVNVVYSSEDLAKPRESPWGTMQREQKEGLELGQDDYDHIDEYSRDIGLPWFASAWDIPSLEFLDRYDLHYNKIASAMITHIPFLCEVADRGKPTFISTGMCTMQDVYRAVDIFTEKGCECILMHCVGTYPCPPEKLNLRFIRTLKNEFPHLSVGYSGHEVGLNTTYAAVALGAEHIERHITLDRSMYGSDQAASIEPGGFRRMVDGVREIEKSLGTGKKLFNGGEQEVAGKLRYWK
uniref:Putative N-acetylneuraminate synthase n=1 Tax=viral metagenome TaxID=1070528 RepID=A0A6M3K3L4_9ZZZZ